MKSFIRVIALLAMLSGLSFAARAQLSADRFKEQLEPVIKRVMQQTETPGFAIAVVEKGKIVYAAGFGVKNITSREAIAPQSLFHMASITKPFVATSIMQLWEAGKIDLDAPVKKYLPYFQLKDERYAAITVRQMLSHISGMPDVADYEWEKPQYDDGALERYVKSLTDKSLIAAPGTKFQYSNMAFEVLGDVIAKVSGKSFEAYVADHILKPLRMRSSTLLVKQADAKWLTSPHIFGKSYEAEVSAVFPYNRMHAPSSTLYSSVLDMCRWAMANLNRGELDGKRILKSSTYDLMWKPAGEQWQQVGISWFLRKYKDYATVTHSGGDVGFVSNLVLIPEKSVAVVMMSNYDRAPLGSFTNAALDVALGLPLQPIVIKPLIDRVLHKTLIKDGIEAAVAQYHDLKKNQPDAYSFQEPLLNNLGYALMERSQVKDAIRIFQLNVEAYPSSSNAYDSLAEAYLADGDQARAIEYYEKALQLNPRNPSAAAALKKLKGQ